MNYIGELLFALSANLDNFTVSVTFGIRKIKISFFNNIIIAVISALGTYLSMKFGHVISRFFPLEISNYIGSSILIFIGLFIMKDFFKHDKKQKNDRTKPNKINSILNKPETADLDSSGSIDMKETALLAAALTLNNFGFGIGSSITGLNIYITVFLTFVFSIISMSIGNIVGKGFMPKTLCKFASLISGLIVVVLGLYEMFV